LFVPAKEAEKTKYALVSNEQDAGKICNLGMENKSFENLAEFKYSDKIQ
jgi:hypothetical protein